MAQRKLKLTVVSKSWKPGKVKEASDINNNLQLFFPMLKSKERWVVGKKKCKLWNEEKLNNSCVNGKNIVWISEYFS